MKTLWMFKTKVSEKKTRYEVYAETLNQAIDKVIKLTNGYEGTETLELICMTQQSLGEE